MRALRKLTLCIAATQAALYSDETYDKLRRLFGRVSRQPASTSSSVERHYQKVETALNEATRKRLDDLLKDTTTEKCRDEVTSTFIDSYKRQISDWSLERTGRLTARRNATMHRAKRLRRRTFDCVLARVHETPYRSRGSSALEEARGTTSSSTSTTSPNRSQPTITYEICLTRPRPRPGRTAPVAWGGFNVVQATFVRASVCLGLDGNFDWIVTASAVYRPRRIDEPSSPARHPSDTEFLEIRPQPNDPCRGLTSS